MDQNIQIPKVVVLKYFLASAQELQRVLKDPGIIQHIRMSGTEIIEYIGDRRGPRRVVDYQGTRTKFIFSRDQEVCKRENSCH